MYEGRGKVSTTTTAWRLWLAALLLAAVSACGSEAATGTTAPVARGVTLTWRDKGHTIHVLRGAPLLLKLNSTYWRVDGSSAPSVVRQTGKVTRRPGHCPPGVGCGTVTAPFKAVGKGTAHLRAHRSNCGEALRCTAGRGRYDVTISVG
jgi:hypothetical protein